MSGERGTDEAWHFLPTGGGGKAKERPQVVGFKGEVANQFLL